MSKIIIIIVIVILTITAGYFIYQLTLPGPVMENQENQTDTNIQKNESSIMNENLSYMDISPETAKIFIDTKPELVIIDVSPHYAEGHLPRAIHYYLGDGSLDNAIPNLNPDKEYLVYCHVDSVSIAGAQKLIDAGFDSVYRLEGNYPAWVDAGYPVEK